MKLEIIVSTLQDGIYNLKFSDKFHYLVIHQIPAVSDNEKYKRYSLTFPCNVKYIQSNTKGLSISRNIGFNNSTADYIWIMDDDVVVLEDSLTKFYKLLSAFLNLTCTLLNIQILYHNLKAIRNARLLTITPQCQFHLLI